MSFLSPGVKPNLSCGIPSMIMMADLSPAAIFNTPSPNEKFSVPDKPVILKSTTISSGAILDK